jgi:hypothetical protein
MIDAIWLDQKLKSNCNPINPKQNIGRKSINFIYIYWSKQGYFDFFLVRVDPPNSWIEPYHELTPDSGFKTMIITIFILVLPQVDHLDPWLWPCPGSIALLSFKTMIITTFILMLIQVNRQPDSWPKLGW